MSAPVIPFENFRAGINALRDLVRGRNRLVRQIRTNTLPPGMTVAQATRLAARMATNIRRLTAFLEAAHDQGGAG